MAIPDVGPDPLSYDYVGELYEQIRSGFTAIPERELFIGDSAAQVRDTWSVRLDLRPVADRRDALAAIDDIIEDGEGAPRDRASSHYGRFLAIRTAYTANGYFDASRPVVRNPRTRAHHPDSTGPGFLITNELSLAVAELFNEVYAAALLVLQQFFAFGGETGPQRDALKAAAGHLMSTGVRPIAEILTTLPAAGDDTGDCAGPPFELYDAVALSPSRRHGGRSCWSDLPSAPGPPPRSARRPNAWPGSARRCRSSGATWRSWHHDRTRLQRLVPGEAGD